MHNSSLSTQPYSDWEQGNTNRSVHVPKPSRDRQVSLLESRGRNAGQSRRPKFSKIECWTMEIDFVPSEFSSKRELVNFNRSMARRRIIASGRTPDPDCVSHSGSHSAAAEASRQVKRRKAANVGLVGIEPNPGPYALADSPTSLFQGGDRMCAQWLSCFDGPDVNANRMNGLIEKLSRTKLRRGAVRGMKKDDLLDAIRDGLPVSRIVSIDGAVADMGFESIVPQSSDPLVASALRDMDAKEKGVQDALHDLDSDDSSSDGGSSSSSGKHDPPKHQSLFDLYKGRGVLTWRDTGRDLALSKPWDWTKTPVRAFFHRQIMARPLTAVACVIGTLAVSYWSLRKKLFSRLLFSLPFMAVSSFIQWIYRPKLVDVLRYRRHWEVEIIRSVDSNDRRAGNASFGPSTKNADYAEIEVRMTHEFMGLRIPAPTRTFQASLGMTAEVLNSVGLVRGTEKLERYEQRIAQCFHVALDSARLRSEFEGTMKMLVALNADELYHQDHEAGMLDFHGRPNVLLGPVTKY